MDYNSRENEAGIDTEQSETGADFRVTDESPRRSPDGRLMYYESQAQRSEHYSGTLDGLTVEEVRGLFGEVLHYFGLGVGLPLQLPPAGLPGLVYFIGAASGPIKIGIAVRPQERLKGLQTGHHEKLALLATCEGGQPLERDYHKRFADQRIGGEWFGRCPEIEAEIARLAQGREP